MPLINYMTEKEIRIQSVDMQKILSRAPLQKRLLLNWHMTIVLVSNVYAFKRVHHLYFFESSIRHSPSSSILYTGKSASRRWDYICGNVATKLLYAGKIFLLIFIFSK